MEKRRDLAWKAHRKGDLQQVERHYRALLNESPEVDDAVNLAPYGANRVDYGKPLIYRSWLPQFPNALQLHLNAANCLRT